MTVDALFTPYAAGPLQLRNRVVMAPMTRNAAPDGLVGQQNADYYARRARGGVGLILTEGTWIPHAAAGNHPAVPGIGTPQAAHAWKLVVDAVHAAGAKIMMQLWHVGLVRKPGDAPNPGTPAVGPSGIVKPGETPVDPMTEADIADVIGAYGLAAQEARRIGFDGVEVHAAHGYLVDQFFWGGTNLRTDQWGGDAVGRTRFAAEVVREIRRRTAADFPIGIRISQWKQQDYSATLVASPAELDRFLAPLTDAGVDIFHMSTRRYWDAAFEGSDRSMAGWARHLTGKTVITVGSVGLDGAFNPQTGGAAKPAGVERLIALLERGDFDLVAVGRAMLVNPDWAAYVRTGDWDRLVPFTPEARKVLS